MCGVAGIIMKDGSSPPQGVLNKLLEALRHRGPDGEGQYIHHNTALVHTRLAIVDLKTGHQPLFHPQGLALVANGEIYNDPELRAHELKEVSFSTHSDCESILHLYTRYGLEFTKYLRGMYAAALYEPSSQTVILARDPFGIKPLYYADTPGCFAFASEAQALLKAGIVPASVCKEGLREMLQLRYTLGSRTIFSQIRRVLPGEVIRLFNGQLVERRLLPLLPESGPCALEEEEALEHLDLTLSESVRIHQRADVPFGLFLSGGIDSSAILSLMARHNLTPVKTFTIGFPNTKAYNECSQARLTAQVVGAEHREMTFEAQDFWTLLPQVVKFSDDPSVDYAALPTFKMAQEARLDVKVILCGEGGDELFAGYRRYRRARLPWWLGGRIIRARGAFDKIKTLSLDMSGWQQELLMTKELATLPERTNVQISQAVDCHTWLPNDLLTKLDRCLMAWGVEGRTPFLDPAVCRFAYTLPDSLKIRKGKGKWLLRKWVAQHLPEAAPFAKKRGFTVPVGEWMAKEGKTLGRLMAQQPGILEICSPQEVTALFENGTKETTLPAWTLLYYALWHHHHVRGLAMGRDVFSTLEGSISSK